MKDGTDDQKDLGARLSFKWEANPDLLINVVGDYFRQRGQGVGGTPVQDGIEGREGFRSPEGAAFLSHQPNVLLGTHLGPFTTPSYQQNEYLGPVLDDCVDRRRSAR